MKLGQAIRGDLWIAKRQVPCIIKVPFEKSMSMASKKAGFQKCGIVPFNPNAIDRTQLMRNKLTPVANVDLSFPPTVDHAEDDESVSYETVEHQNDLAQPASDDISDSPPTLQLRQSVINEGESTSQAEIATPENPAEAVVAPIVIRVTTGLTFNMEQDADSTIREG